jgi:hypothetical protein
MASLCAAFALFTSSASAATGARGYTGTQVFSTVGGDKDPGEPDHCGEPGGASSWFFYKAPRSGIMMVDTKGSSFDTVLAVYIGPGTDFASLTNVACNNDHGPNELWSQVVFDVSAGTMYYIAVDGVGGASGTVKLNYQVGDPLEITNQPQAFVQGAGGGASFEVGATGLAPLTYQWYSSGTPIVGATQSTLTLPTVTCNGSYTVLVKDAAYSLLSAAASLTVCPHIPPTNGVLASQVLLDGVYGLRLVGNAPPGSIVEGSQNLIDWEPLYTNTTSQDLFIFDQPMDRPQLYFRIRRKEEEGPVPN